MKTMLKAALLFVVALALVAADEAEPKKKLDATPPKADVRGLVTSVNALKGKDLVGKIRVEGKREKDTGYDKALVTLTTATKIYFWDGEKKEAKFTDLKAGIKVQCTFTGTVLESYPVQARASEVLILPEEKKKTDD